MTAFMTNKGLYEWNRVPMGLKGAPGYFQSQITEKVLAGLRGQICEVYIDDGADGTRIVKEQLQQVEDFVPPKNIKHLRSFIGLCEYFHYHVANLEALLQPLRDLIPKNPPSKREAKSTPVEWTEDALAHFQRVKQAVIACPKLFFLDEDSPIYLHTDASDYGIGGYLFQMEPNPEFGKTPDAPQMRERPIRFISKKLNAFNIVGPPTKRSAMPSFIVYTNWNRCWGM